MSSLAEPLPDPVRLARRRADGAEGTQARDRLVTTLMLTALLHALIVLGVSFSAPASHGEGAQGTEILLVSEELPEARRNDTATYLSQRTQTGSGNTRERLPAQLPGAAATEAAPMAANRSEINGDQVITTQAATRSRLRMVALAEPEVVPAPRSVQERAEPRSAKDDALRLRGEVRGELYVTADTRASRLAPYLDGWRQRVERIGTINYPSVAQRRGLSGNPVIEVVVQSNGKLKTARVLHSSGHAEIDAAALAILRLASPFDPFPPALTREYQTMRFSYEWRFEGSGAAPGVVTLP